VYQLHLNKIVFKGNIEDSNNKISTFDKNIGCCTNKQRTCIGHSQAPTRAAENIPEKFEMSISYRTIFLKIVLK
jgi:hypothetical protein